MGRCGETWGDVARSGEIWGDMRLPVDRQLKQGPVDQRRGCVDGGGQQDERDANERLLRNVLVLQPPVERRAEVRGLLR